MIYYLCPDCKQLTQPSVMGHRFRWCSYCGKNHDFDECIDVESEKDEQ